jgi:hypothetical protein
MYEGRNPGCVSWLTRIFWSAVPTKPPTLPASQPCNLDLSRQNDAVFFCSQNFEEALQEVSAIESLRTLLPDIPAIYPVWKRIVEDYRVQGVKVYDARLAAVMSVYAIKGVLTFNGADFNFALNYPNT